jgi:hypothetical protein
MLASCHGRRLEESPASDRVGEDGDAGDELHRKRPHATADTHDDERNAENGEEDREDAFGVAHRFAAHSSEDNRSRVALDAIVDKSRVKNP